MNEQSEHSEQDQQDQQDREDLLKALRQRRCIPCLTRQHERCWSLQQVPGYLIDLYWCECPCHTGEMDARQEAFLENQQRPHE